MSLIHSRGHKKTIDPSQQILFEYMTPHVSFQLVSDTTDSILVLVPLPITTLNDVNILSLTSNNKYTDNIVNPSIWWNYYVSLVTDYWWQMIGNLVSNSWFVCRWWIQIFTCLSVSSFISSRLRFGAKHCRAQWWHFWNRDAELTLASWVVADYSTAHIRSFRLIL